MSPKSFKEIQKFGQRDWLVSTSISLLVIEIDGTRHYNPSKLNHIASLLKQWKGQEELFEYNVMKNYHVTRVLSREIFYVSNTLCDQSIDSKSAMKDIDLAHAFAIDISPIEVCEKAIVKHENRDIDHLYFIVDLREEAAINVGCFGIDFDLDCFIGF